MNRSSLSGSRLLVVAAVAAMTGLAACGPSTALPGTTLGTYSVTGHITSTTCGASFGAPDPWAFNVQLSKDGSTLYWSWMDGSPYISGLLDTATSTSTTIVSSTSSNVDPTDAGAGPCTMERDDNLVLTLATGTTPATFTGTYNYAFSAVTGSNCSDQLASSGGTYQTIPCTVGYTMTATKN